MHLSDSMIIVQIIVSPKRFKTGGPLFPRWADLNPMELLAPKICILCAERGELLCHMCLQGLEKLTHPCPRCAYPRQDQHQACRECVKLPRKPSYCRSIYPYLDDQKKVLHKIKFEHYSRLIPLITPNPVSLEWPPWIEAMVPIPERLSRKLKRPFNPAEQIARYLGKHKEWPIINALKVDQKSASQSKLSRKDRQINPHFRVSQSLPNGILLVDDVITTGSTMAQATQVLKRNGVQNIAWFSLFRTL